jgi:hypothetical protein
MKNHVECLRMCHWIQRGHGSRTLCSRTIRFTNKFSEKKNVSDDERFLGLRTRKLATAASWKYQRRSQLLVTLAQYTSVLDFGLWTFRFTNCLQERIKFMNRGPTVLLKQILYEEMLIIWIRKGKQESNTITLSTGNCYWKCSLGIYRG